MSIYTLIVIIGTLMIIGGISLAATPLMTFVTAGSFIFSILSLVLGMAGLVTPGAAAIARVANEAEFSINK